MIKKFNADKINTGEMSNVNGGTVKIFNARSYGGDRYGENSLILVFDNPNDKRAYHNYLKWKRIPQQTRDYNEIEQVIATEEFFQRLKGFCDRKNLGVEFESNF